MGEHRLYWLQQAGTPLDDSHLDALAALYRELDNCRGVELLPYHPFGQAKHVRLGQDAPDQTDSVPPPEALDAARQRRRRGRRCPYGRYRIASFGLVASATQVLSDYRFSVRATRPTGSLSDA